MRFFKRLLCAACAALVLLSAASCSRRSGEAGIPADETPAVVRVTFPEGLTVYEIALLLEKNAVCSADDFIARVNGASGEFAAGIDNPGERPFLLEGYVFPDTYEFYIGESAQTALDRFLSNMRAKYTSELAAEADRLGMTMDETLTLASIIQEEASDVAEMAKVSSVLHNRLNSELEYMRRLQCDATIFYLDDSVEPYIEGGAEKYKPYYNTYVCYGLPAGPICSPGAAAIEAALRPETTDYLFFVSDRDGVYYYSETYERHLEYCRQIGIE